MFVSAFTFETDYFVFASDFIPLFRVTLSVIFVDFP
jgi:hypothetical protein